MTKSHPQRIALHNEIHARPPEAMNAPLALSHIVMLADAAQREASRAHLAALLRDHHLPLPDADANHLRMDLGTFRVRWELHTEFVSWTFSRPLDPQGTATAAPPAALDAVPQAWLSALPGQRLAALHLWALAAADFAEAPPVRGLLGEETLVGALVADGHAAVYTDFMLHADGFSRMLLLARPGPGGEPAVSPRRLGRLVQRLLEIDTYRMAALLGLPAARATGAALGVAERELAELAAAIRAAGRAEEPQLLDRLTKLAGEVEGQYAASHARFSASGAYFELVDRRLADIREARLAGLQTIGEFIDRRLSPARATCEWATRRQDALSQRVSRISNLLRTRVEIEQQQSSQALLAAMNRRQGLQLQLQATVEGLSVAAITYYIVGLVSYLAKGAHAIGWPWSAESTAAVAIPLVAFGVWWSLRRLHSKVLAA
ncbi:DUF3422 domain-containing protein [Ramlibacter sp.]|uniref:DUF3422 family protein n=1 Tax=Ramlibacter sp. TaxID=1917967 RepID=UPI002D190948|nr:DUF3422 domain-containing protein [Ramlibacter sp.]HWI82592.1 DUF3422 domain-containing protein [Ramlibacter sp.]